MFGSEDLGKGHGLAGPKPAGGRTASHGSSAPQEELMKTLEASEQLGLGTSIYSIVIVIIIIIITYNYIYIYKSDNIDNMDVYLYTYI